MKKTLILLLAVLATATIAAAQAAPAATPAPAQTSPADPIAAITKERDEARSQIDILQKNAQQAAVVTEYYKVVAERNEALLRLTQANTQIAALQGEVDHLRAAAAPAKK